MKSEELGSFEAEGVGVEIISSTEEMDISLRASETLDLDLCCCLFLSISVDRFALRLDLLTSMKSWYALEFFTTSAAVSRSLTDGLRDLAYSEQVWA